MRGTAAVASLFVLLAGFGVGTYFIAFRPVGAQPASAGLELAILGASVLVLAVLANLAVGLRARAVGGRDTEKLLARALEIDATDPDAIREFESIPALRDLVSGWIAERGQVRDLGDRVETLRGEMDAIADGMRRSAQDLGRIREQPSSPLGVQIVATWNTMVERLKQSPGASPGANAPGPRGVGAAVGVSPANEPIVRTLVSRLDELEAELDRLRGHVSDGPVLEILDPEVEEETRAHAHTPSRVSILDEAPLELEPIEELELVIEPTSLGAENALSRVDSESALARASWHADDDAQSERPDTWGEVEVVEPLPRTQAWHVVSEEESSTLFLSETGVQPQAAADSAADSDPRFEDLDFPHFIGKPVRSLDDRLAVTYEGQDAAAEAAELPASSLLFDDEPGQNEPPVFDLGRPAHPERDR